MAHPNGGVLNSRAVEPKRILTRLSHASVCPSPRAARRPRTLLHRAARSAPVAAAPRPPTARRSRRPRSPSSAPRRFRRRSWTRCMTQVCVQYKAAKKACPKPGTAERKQLQQSFVAQLVQQAEFDEAGKQLKVTVKQADVDSNLQKLELQYAKGTNGKVDPAKWKKVLTDNHTTRGRRCSRTSRRAPAPGHLRQADEERHGRRRGRRGLLREEQEDLRHAREPRRSATSWSRTRRSPTRSTRSSPRATRSSRRWPRSTRSIPARRRAAASWAASRRARPSRRSTRSRSASRPARSRSPSRAPTGGT